MLTELHTPVGDGDVLLLPLAEQLPAMLDVSCERLHSMDFTVAGLPAARLRKQAQAELVEQLGVDLPSPWVATGHQSEMHHAGVWFKDAAAVAWAEATGGTALHVVADLDTVSHAALAVPCLGDDGILSVFSASFAWPAGRQCPAQLPAPPPDAVAEIVQLAPIGKVFDVWAARAAARAGQGTLAEWIAASRAAANESLGLRLHDVYWSRVVRGRAFGRFAAAICLGAERMLACHTEALAAHRAAHGITNPTQPVPDLHHSDGTVEVPLWVFRGDGPREPLFVRRVEEAVELLTPAGPLASLRADGDAAVATITALGENGTMIAPRALTLTMYLRAFVVDVFIHGTGGARYDVMGDQLAWRWFEWSPPPFATATATLRPGLPRFRVTAADRSAARWAVHHAWHNPYASGVTDGEAASAEAVALRKRKIAALERMATAPRFSADRAAAYAEIHAANDELRRCLPAGQEAVAERLRRIESELAHNELAGSREYFFALMDAAKLSALIEKARRWASG